MTGDYTDRAMPRQGAGAPVTMTRSDDRLWNAEMALARLVTRHPLLIVIVAVVLSVFGYAGTAQLHVNSDFAELLPSRYPSVQALYALRDTIGGESAAAVVVEGATFDDRLAFAERLIPYALALTGADRDEPYFTRSAFRRDVSFLQDNALYFATLDELDTLDAFLQRSLEREVLEANPFYFDLDEDDEDGTVARDDSLASALVEDYRGLIGSEYPMSPDSSAIAVRLYPSGSQTDIQFIRETYADLRALTDSLNQAEFGGALEVTVAGRLLRQLVQIETITDDVADTFLAGAALLLFVVVGYFYYKAVRARTVSSLKPKVLLQELARTPATAMLIALPLIAAEVWTFGIAHIAYGSLNIMTAALGLVLFGLGIDFGIHVYARYAEERGAGASISNAISKTIHTTGRAVAVVAITTAAAFYVLMLADFRGFSEFGFIAGNGILLGLIAMLVVLPALLVLFERWRFIDLRPVRTRTTKRQKKRRRVDDRYPALAIIALAIAATVASILLLPRVAFEYDFGQLSPDYPEYDSLNAKVRRVYSDHETRNAAYILTGSIDETYVVADAIRRHMSSDTLTPTIRDVETLGDRFPMTAAAATAKLERIANIRARLDDIPGGTLDSESLDLLRRAAGTRRVIDIDQVPEFIRRPFTTKSGTIANLVIIYPAESLSDGRRSMAFADDVGTVRLDDGRVYHAGSTPIVASDMLRLMQKEAPIMVALTLLLVVAFKVVILRKPRWILLALTPLVASFLWMFALMPALGMKLTFYNLVVLPTVLGIGDDSGIHIVHRYREEGPGQIRRVLRSTGEHVTVSALTTMVGFAGLLTSMHPGMRTIGELAVLGIGMTLVAALVALPATIVLLERRHRPPEAPTVRRHFVRPDPARA